MTIQVLALENAILRNCFEAARIGICVLDPQGVIVTVTPLFARSIGVEIDSLLGAPQSVLAHTMAIQPRWQSLLGLDQPEIATEATVALPDGSRQQLLLEACSFSYLDLQYRLISLIDFSQFGVSRDNLIAFSRQVEGVRTSIVVADAQQHDLPIVYANPQFFEVTGYRPSEILGRNCRLLQGAATEKDHVEQIRSALRAMRVVTTVLTNYRKNGTTFLNELTISPLFDDAGRLTHFAATQRVVSSREPLGSGIGKR
jgi:PAS domain S-box-containing protein